MFGTTMSHHLSYHWFFQELRDQEKHIEQLRGAVRAKGQPLKVAQACFAFLSCNLIISTFTFQARLAMRQRLPGDEACLDLAHVMLIEEVIWISFVL